MGGELARRIVSLEVGLNADAIDFASGGKLAWVGSGFDFGEARIFAFGDNFADVVRSHVNYRGKGVGGGFGVFYDSGLGENGLNFVAGGKYPASAIEYHAALGLMCRSGLLLLCRSSDVAVGFAALQVKTASRKREKHRNQSDHEEGNYADASGFFIL